MQRATVTAFLNCAYSRILDTEFERQQEDPRLTVTGLTQLLGFADAVGASRGVLAACLSELNQLQLKAPLQPPRNPLPPRSHTVGRPAHRRLQAGLHQAAGL